MIRITLCACLVALAVSYHGALCGRLYNTSSARHQDMLNIHIVPHTHDDGGWLKTFDQYFYGTRQDIQMANVQLILDSIVQSLLEDPNRRFSYAEMGFFKMWWQRQTLQQQEVVRQLVREGRLDFINGGYVQHDEAAAHYAAMIDQTTLGHRFLNATFGLTPAVGWQVDPFGHSATQAALMTSLLGFKALFFGRADYQDMTLRKQSRSLELVWRGSSSWGPAGDTWVHNYPSGNYGTLPGFDWNWENSLNPPLVDDPESPEYNIKERIDSFVSLSQQWAQQIRGNDILYMWGSDFEYANAHHTYGNLDMLIHYANLDGRVNVMYSTPAEYVQAKAGYENVTWPLKTDDFFPYADCAHCYWTGYFTSRPTAKAFIRLATATLAAARQLHVTAGLNARRAKELHPLEAAAALAQHHDAITGTAKQAVANDYNRQLHAGLVQARQLMLDALQQLLQPQPAPSGEPTTTRAAAEETVAVPAATVAGTATGNKQAEPTVAAAAAAAQHAGQSLTAAAVPAAAPLSRPSSSILAAARKLLWALPQPASAQTQGALSRSSAAHLMTGPEVETSQAAPAAAATTAAPSHVSSPTLPHHQQQQRLGVSSELQLSFCEYLNASICDASVTWSAEVAAAAAASPGSPGSPTVGVQGAGVERPAADPPMGDPGDLLVVGHNPLAWPRRHHVQVPLGARVSQVTGTDAAGNIIPVQLLPLPASTAAVQAAMAAAGQGSGGGGGGVPWGTQLAAFTMQLPPLGYAAYTLQVAPSNSSRSSSQDTSSTSSSSTNSSSTNTSTSSSATGTGNTASSTPQGPSQPTTLNGQPTSAAGQMLRRIGRNGGSSLQLELDESTGLFTRLLAADGSWGLEFSQQLMYYISSVGEGPLAGSASKPATAAAGDGDDDGSSSFGSRLSSLGHSFHSITNIHNNTSSSASLSSSSSSSSTMLSSSSVTREGVGGGQCGLETAQGPRPHLQQHHLVNMGQASGAYIFRPGAAHPGALPVLAPGQTQVVVEVVEGPLLTEVRQQFADWAYLTTRLWSSDPSPTTTTTSSSSSRVGGSGGSHTTTTDNSTTRTTTSYNRAGGSSSRGSSSSSGGGGGSRGSASVGSWGWLEQEWTLGPLPIGDGAGKEVVLRTTTNLSTGGVLWTDSNGREMLPRALNRRPSWPLQVEEPVAGNYYPITSGAAISDGCLTLQVATDRAQGAASLAEGQLEVMLHRRTLVDDQRGVGEPLNETQCGCTACGCGGLVARGTQVLLVGPAPGAGRRSRAWQQALNDPVFLAFGRVAAQQAQQAQHDGQAVAAQHAQQVTQAQLVQQGVAEEQLAHAADKQEAAATGTAAVVPRPTAAQLQRVWSGFSRSAAPAPPAANTAGAAAAASGALAVSGLPENVHLLTLMSLDGDTGAPASESPSSGRAARHTSGTSSANAAGTASSDDSGGASGPVSDVISNSRDPASSSNSSNVQRLLIRLAHSFQSGEDSELSQPAYVDLSQLVPGTVTSIDELNLSGARYRRDMQPPSSWPLDAGAAESGTGAASGADAASGTDAGGAAQGLRGATFSSRGGEQPHEAAARWGDAGVSSSCHLGVTNGVPEGVTNGPTKGGREGGSQGDGPWNVWDHSGGDKLPRVELFPMEIRTFEVAFVREG